MRNLVLTLSVIVLTIADTVPESQGVGIGLSKSGSTDGILAHQGIGKTFQNTDIRTIDGVNLYTGQNNLSLKLFDLPLPGLNLSLTLDYNSNVRENINSSNINRSTSWVGLGWDIMWDVIYVEHNETVDFSDDEYYYRNDQGVVSRILYRNGMYTVEGAPHLDLQPKIDARLDNQVITGWTMKTTDGILMQFGDHSYDVPQSTNRNLFFSGDRVNTDPLTSSERYFYAWDVRTVAIPRNNISVEYKYYQNQRAIAANSKQTYTAGVYLAEIKTNIGHIVKFHLGDKDNGIEYHVNPNMNSFYENNYLKQIDITNSSNLKNTFKFDYSEQHLNRYPNFDLYAKRLLQRVYVTAPPKDELPLFTFTYYNQGEEHGLLKTFKTTSNGVHRYTYTMKKAERNPLQHPLRETDEEAFSGDVALEKTYHGDDFIITVDKGNATSTANVTVHYMVHGIWTSQSILGYDQHGDWGTTMLDIQYTDEQNNAESIIVETLDNAFVLLQYTDAGCFISGWYKNGDTWEHKKLGGVNASGVFSEEVYKLPVHGGIRHNSACYISALSRNTILVIQKPQESVSKYWYTLWTLNNSHKWQSKQLGPYDADLEDWVAAPFDYFVKFHSINPSSFVILEEPYSGYIWGPFGDKETKDEDAYGTIWEKKNTEWHPQQLTFYDDKGVWGSKTFSWFTYGNIFGLGAEARLPAIRKRNLSSTNAANNREYGFDYLPITQTTQVGDKLVVWYKKDGSWISKEIAFRNNDGTFGRKALDELTFRSDFLTPSRDYFIIKQDKGGHECFLERWEMTEAGEWIHEQVVGRNPAGQWVRNAFPYLKNIDENTSWGFEHYGLHTTVHPQNDYYIVSHSRNRTSGYITLWYKNGNKWERLPLKAIDLNGNPTDHFNMTNFSGIPKDGKSWKDALNDVPRIVPGPNYAVVMDDRGHKGNIQVYTREGNDWDSQTLTGIRPNGEFTSDIEAWASAPFPMRQIIPHKNGLSETDAPDFTTCIPGPDYFVLRQDYGATAALSMWYRKGPSWEHFHIKGLNTQGFEQALLPHESTDNTATIAIPMKNTIGIKQKHSQESALCYLYWLQEGVPGTNATSLVVEKVTKDPIWPNDQATKLASVYTYGYDQNNAGARPPHGTYRPQVAAITFKHSTNVVTGAGNSSYTFYNQWGSDDRRLNGHLKSVNHNGVVQTDYTYEIYEHDWGIPFLAIPRLNRVEEKTDGVIETRGILDFNNSNSKSRLEYRSSPNDHHILTQTRFAHEVYPELIELNDLNSKVSTTKLASNTMQVAEWPPYTFDYTIPPAQNTTLQLEFEQEVLEDIKQGDQIQISFNGCTQAHLGKDQLNTELILNGKYAKAIGLSQVASEKLGGTSSCFRYHFEANDPSSISKLALRFHGNATRVILRKPKARLHKWSDADVIEARAATWSKTKTHNLAWARDRVFIWNRNQKVNLQNHHGFPFENPKQAASLGWKEDKVFAKYSRLGLPVQTTDAFRTDATAIYGINGSLVTGNIINANRHETGVLTCDYTNPGRIEYTNNYGPVGLDYENAWEYGLRNDVEDDLVELTTLQEQEQLFGEKCIKVQNAYGPTKNFKIDAETDYVLSAWVRVPAGGQSAILHADYRKGHSSEEEGGKSPFLLAQESFDVTGSPIVVSAPESQAQEGWVYRELHVRATADLRGRGDGWYIRAHIGVPSGGPIYLQDVRFYPADALVTTTYYDTRHHLPRLSVEANGQPSLKKSYDGYGRATRWERATYHDGKIVGWKVVKEREYHNATTE